MNEQGHSRKKIIVLLPDGIGVRNFILSDFASVLASTGMVTVWHALPADTVGSLADGFKERVSWQPLPLHAEGSPAFLSRRAKMVAQLRFQREPGTDIILDHILSRTGSGLRAFRAGMAAQLGSMFSHSHIQILLLDRMHALVVRNSRYYQQYLDFLRREQPDIVFCSHQRSERAVPAMLAARELGIPTATFIYSWDNLPKGRMAVHADHFLVWSEHMRAEMQQYYPDVADERIHVVGTPQFEHYFNTSLIEPRAQFLAGLGMDPARPVVCFSGDDLTTSPHDPDYLEDLALALRQAPPERRPQVLFRRNPTDTSDRYKEVLAAYPEIFDVAPRWQNLSQNDWSKVVPSREDLHLLVNTVAHSDVVVNVGSTMAVDFAILDKPAVYLAYNPRSRQPGEQWSIERVYRYPHFNPMPAFDPVDWARSPDELCGVVMDSIEHPERKAHNRREWLRFLAAHPLDQASQRCVDALQEIVNRKYAHRLSV